MRARGLYREQCSTLELASTKGHFLDCDSLARSPLDATGRFCGVMVKKAVEEKSCTKRSSASSISQKTSTSTALQNSEFPCEEMQFERTLDFKKGSDSFDFQGLHEFSDPICLHLDQGLYACQVSQGNTRRASLSVTSRSWMI